jgi:hypothetical protein
MYLTAPETEDKWYKFQFPDPFLGYNLKRLFETYKIRVKYLDREDIESESFNYKPINGEKDVMLFNSDRKDSRGEKVSLIYNPKSNWLLVFTGEWSITVWEEYNAYNFNPTLFAGYIKNATEFKKILKQLNINEKTS